VPKKNKKEPKVSQLIEQKKGVRFNEDATFIQQSTNNQQKYPYGFNQTLLKNIAEFHVGKEVRRAQKENFFEYKNTEERRTQRHALKKQARAKAERILNAASNGKSIFEVMNVQNKVYVPPEKKQKKQQKASKKQDYQLPSKKQSRLEQLRSKAKLLMLSELNDAV